MLTTRTAYPITKSNMFTLSFLSGLPINIFAANVGWCATYSEVRLPRWGIVPRSVVNVDNYFFIDEESYI